MRSTSDRSVLVIGSGIAGLVTALTASRHSAVTLITKGELLESNTLYAQGGIAAATSADDSPALHAHDTVQAGHGLSSVEAAAVLCADAPDLIDDLLAWGVPFDREGGELARGLEAAHSRPRILHAGGDATGRGIELALAHAVRASSVTIRENVMLTDLVVRDGEDFATAEIQCFAAQLFFDRQPALLPEKTVQVDGPIHIRNAIFGK